MRELLTDGPVRLEVLVDGPPGPAADARPAVVLLPSSQRDAGDLGALAAALCTAGFQVLRPHPRGMGGSRGPMADLSLHALAQDVRRVIDRLAGGRALVAGHAYGHYVARVTELDHPEAVRGLVLLAAAAREQPAGLTEALDAAADAGRPESERLALLRQVMFAAPSDPRPWLEGWHPSLRAAYRAAATRPGRATWWTAGQAPILDLQGADDPWRPASTRDELRAALGPRVRVRCIERASHALPVEQPQAVADAIVDWARDLPA